MATEAQAIAPVEPQPGARRVATPHVVCFATKGAGSNEEDRVARLLADLAPELYAFDRGNKAANVLRLLGLLRRARPEMVVMEGTGLAGGLTLLLARKLLGVPYVVSSGDAVGPFLAGRRRALAVPGWLYELALVRSAAGFIGWTPYLAGRALTMGCRRVMTAAHFAADTRIRVAREDVRQRLGIPEDAIVAGIVGNLAWNERYRYCYGWELVAAMRRVRRPDVHVVIAGGGPGIERLRELAGDDLGRRVHIPGAIEPALVPSYLAAMDIGSLPQSVDQVGGSRYTTKLPEYIAARLPVITGQIPAAYDVMADWSLRLPGEAPWDPRYVDALARLLERVTADDIERLRSAIPVDPVLFSADDQQRRAAAFVADLVEREHR